MDAEDFTPVHLSCEFLSFSFFPLQFGHQWHYFLHSYRNRRGAELLKFKLGERGFFSFWRISLGWWNPIPPSHIQCRFYNSGSRAAPALSAAQSLSGVGLVFLGFFWHFWFHVPSTQANSPFEFHALVRNVANSSRELHKADREVQVGYQGKFHLQRVFGTAQGMLTFPRLPKLQECWDKAPRDAQGVGF